MTRDSECEDRRTGEMCCLDLEHPLRWRRGKSGLRRKCCNNPHGVPIKAPQRDLTEKELRKVRMSITLSFSFSRNTRVS